MATKQLDPTKSVAALFGAKVRQLRMEAGLSQLELGERVFVSHTRIAKIELATDPPSFRLAQQLDEALNAGGVLTELWPHIFSPYPDFSQRFIELQAQAVVIHEFSQVVPGLLQTPGYARAILTAGQVFGDRDLEKVITTRLARQQVFERESPPWYWVILDEAALYRSVGGSEVMREQLEYLTTVTERDRVSVRVCPRDKVHPAVMNGSMSLLTLADGTRYAYREGIKSGQLSENPDEVIAHSVLYDLLQARALLPEASAALINDVIQEHYS